MHFFLTEPQKTIQSQIKLILLKVFFIFKTIKIRLQEVRNNFLIDFLVDFLRQILSVKSFSSIKIFSILTLVGITYPIIKDFTLPTIGMTTVVGILFYNIIKKYNSLKQTKKMLCEYLRNALLVETHEESMEAIKAIFRSKAWVPEQKSALLMEGGYEGRDNTLLQMIAKDKNDYNLALKQRRDALVIELIQEYLSTDQINQLLGQRFLVSINNRTIEMNIFGLLIKRRNIELMEALLEMPHLNSEQKFNFLIQVKSEQSALLMTSSYLDLLYSRTGHEIVSFLLEVSKSFTIEQNLDFLTRPEGAHNPLTHLAGVPVLQQMVRGAIEYCNAQLKSTGLSLEILGVQKNVPKELLNMFVEYSALNQNNSGIVSNGIERAEKLRLRFPAQN